MARFYPLALSLLAAPTCAEVFSVYLAMEPPREQQQQQLPTTVRLGAVPPPQSLPMTLDESEARRHVEEMCSMDVMMHCSHDHLLGGGDPMLNWMMRPLDVPPPFFIRSDPIGDILTQMMDSALSVPPPIVVAEEEQSTPAQKEEQSTPAQEEEEKEVAEQTTPVERVFDSMVTSLAEHVASSESASADEPEEEETTDEQEDTTAVDPINFAKRVVEFGHQVLQEPEAPEERRRLARRLTQVDPNTFVKQSRPRLPFGCHKSKCLWSMFDQGRVSHPCTAALIRLENVVEQQQVVRRQEAIANIHRIEQQQDAFLLMLFVYGILALGTMVLLIRRFRKRPDKLRLKRRILQAIYSNPSLKAALEKELHEDLGTVPPLAPRVLATMSTEGRRRIRRFQQFRPIRLGLFIMLMCLALVQPMITMFVLCILMGVRFFHLCLCPKKDLEDCTCCCCGGSTKDVREGTVLAQQACCNCCRGTGVCAPECDSCCCCSSGDGGCDGGCSDGCCDNVSYSSDGCNCCCCCGCSEKDAMLGNVTEKQMACDCCCGTGKCSCNCNCCCSSDDTTSIAAPPATRRRKTYAQNVAYEGVPVQVV